MNIVIKYASTFNSIIQIMKLNKEWLYNSNLIKIINVMESYGGNVRFVGGCVRDSLLNRKVHDIDIVTDLIPSKVMSILIDSNIKAIPTGIRYGTVTAVINDQSFEITTLRSDISCDGRRADVKFTNDWHVDASRRDFTFNAIYCDKNGILYDYFFGIDDLFSKKLRFIGNSSKRIREDYLRILRAFRFSAQICDGNLSDDIMDNCAKYADKISLLSRERIRDEFFKIISSGHCKSSLEKMEISGVLKYILPYKISYQGLSFQKLKTLDSLAKLAAILRTIKNYDEKISEEVSHLFSLSKKQKKELSCMLKRDFLRFPWPTLYQQKNIILFGKELYCNIVKILNQELNAEVEEKYLLFAENFNFPKFPVSGSDLMEIGLREGKMMGDIMGKLKVKWENNSFSGTKDELLNYAKKLIRDK